MLQRDESPGSRPLPALCPIRRSRASAALEVYSGRRASSTGGFCHRRGRWSLRRSPECRDGRQRPVPGRETSLQTSRATTPRTSTARSERRGRSLRVVRSARNGHEQKKSTGWAPWRREGRAAECVSDEVAYTVSYLACLIYQYTNTTPDVKLREGTRLVTKYNPAGDRGRSSGGCRFERRTARVRGPACGTCKKGFLVGVGVRAPMRSAISHSISPSI